MKIQLLGKLQVEFRDGSVMQLQADKISALLVYLAANADRAIQRTQLASLFWGGYPDRDARRNLTNTLSRLKKLLPLKPHLITTRQSITFSAAELVVDSQQFDHLWSQCATVGRSAWAGDPQITAWLTELVALYQGGFADGLTLPDSMEFETWAVQRLEQYQQQTLIALETLTEHHLMQRAYDSAEKHAQRQLTLEPWREVAHRQLMQLHIATNNRSAAVAQFERCKRTLWNELGVEPSPETAAVLKTQSAEAAATPSRNRRSERRKVRDAMPTGSRDERAGGRRSRRSKSGAFNAFFGRKTELEELQKLIADPDTWLITLHGEGGMGKTRLARAAETMFSAEFEDGVHFVQLVSVTDPAAITSAIIETVGLRLQGKADPFDQLCNYLADQQTLLILDNLEHLLVADENTVVDQLLDLLDAAPDAVILVTSRQRLWVQAERVVRLRGLPHPAPPGDHTWQQHEAVQLFIERVRQSDPDFDPAQAREPIIQICRLVEGLPLGIELAAAQSNAWSPETVADELTRGLLLSTRMRDIPKRQRSLKTVFNYSWELLEEEFRPILAQAAIMRGSFNYDAFHAITGGSLTDLETLLTHALIRRAENERFDIHEMVRQFALAHLDPTSLQAAKTRHVTHSFELLATHEQTVLSHSELSIPAIRNEWGHIEQAWTWTFELGELQPLYTATLTLSRYWYIGGLPATALPMLTTAQSQLSQQQHTHPLTQHVSLMLRGLLIWVTATSVSMQSAWKWVQSVLNEQDHAITPLATVIALFTQGLILYARGHCKQSLEAFEKAYSLAEQNNFDVWQFVTNTYVVMTLANYGRLPEAQLAVKRAHLLANSLSGEFYVGRELGQQAWIQVWTWALSDGINSYEHNLKIRDGFMTARRVSSSVTTLGFAYYKVGAFGKAREILYMAEQPDQRDNHPSLDTGGYYVLSLTRRRMGHFEAAIEFGQLGVDRTNSMGAGVYHLWSRAALGLALCAAQRFADAQAVLLEARRRMENSEASENWFTLIEGSLAHCYAAAGDWKNALQTVDSIYDKLIAADAIYTRLEQTWYCYQILHHQNDSRAADLLQHARAVLNYRAALLTPEHCDLFLNNFPEHKQILTLTSG